MDVLAPELGAVVAHKDAGQKPGLAEDLETVADADNELASLCFSFDSAHNRRKAGDGATAQVVAVGEATRQDDRVVVRQVAFRVPDEVSFLMQQTAENIVAVVVAPGAGEDE